MLSARRADAIYFSSNNTSAIAALCKGYSAAPDSARILQAFATLRLDIDGPIWFQWVPSKANIADLPSRREFGLLEELGSSEVPLILPLFANWDVPFARWSSCPEGSTKERGRGSIAVGNLASRAREAADPAAWEVRVDRAGATPFPVREPVSDEGLSGQSCSDRSLREAASSRRVGGESGSFL
eukprot:scaffold5647_cov100-Isochrysis_galbana.AAC.2